MQIFVNMGTAKTIPLDVQEHFTIENLMAMVQDAEGIALTHHVLELAGERLIEGYTLADYNIQAETTLNLFDQRTVENWCTVQQAEQADSRNKRQRVEPPPFSRPILVEAAGFTPYLGHADTPYLGHADTPYLGNADAPPGGPVSSDP